MTRRLFAALLGLSVTVLALFAVVDRGQSQVALERGAVIDLERDAFKLAVLAQDSLESRVNERNVGRIRAWTRHAAGVHGSVAVVADRDGRIVAFAPRRSARRFSATVRAHVRIGLRRTAATVTRVDIDGTRYQIARVPVRANEGAVGVVLLAQRNSTLDAAVANQLRLLTPIFLVAVALSALLAFLLARALSRPIQQLASATHRVAREARAAPKVVLRGPPEVRDLGESFNTMSQRVRDLLDRQAQFAGDVSHQLRTPLTTIGVGLENLRQRYASLDVTDAAPHLALVADEVERLKHLVEGLLVLARSTSDAPRHRVDVAVVARERVASWRDLAREQNVEFELHAPEHVGALAVDGAVDQILDNVFDNALNVAPPGSAIEIFVTSGAECVRIAVRDHGPGLSENARAHAFDRFWRGDHTDIEGLGIGLAIVRDLTEASRGSIELVPAPGGGLEVVLELEPVSGASARGTTATGSLRLDRGVRRPGENRGEASDRTDE